MDDWQDFADIKWRQVFQLTPAGGKEVVGATSFEGTTEVNTDTHAVFMFSIQVLNIYFPDQDPATSAQFDQLIRSFVPLTFNASLDRLIAYMPKPQSENTVALKNDPPFIFVSYTQCSDFQEVCACSGQQTEMEKITARPTRGTLGPSMIS